jgi:hypothetical protein
VAFANQEDQELAKPGLDGHSGGPARQN